MKIIVHPKVAAFNRPGFLGNFGLKMFATEQFYRLDIPSGEEFLRLVHTEKHIRKIKRACEVGATIAEMQLTPECYEIACLGVGTAILAAEEESFAIQCMTGHHAGKETAMGFNLFNSIAIATQRLVNQGKKVCILDIDGHHGNGTENIFRDTDQVMFCSIHQEGAFPETGRAQDVEGGRGKARILNIPLQQGSGDDDLLASIKRIVERTIDFKPDIIGVYAGFDGYHLDELLSLKYSLEGFYECGKMIGHHFEHVFAVLGGGYHQDLAKCTFAFVDGVNQKKFSPEGR